MNNNDDYISVFSNISSLSQNLLNKNTCINNDKNIYIEHDTNINECSEPIKKINNNFSNKSIPKSDSSCVSNSNSGASSSSSNNKFDSCHINKIYIDVAVLCEEYTNIITMCDVHVLNLDEINISLDIFQHIFYPYKENFGLNKDFLSNNNKLLPYISFLSEFRSINNKKFNLLEEIIGNIETDLCISRNCFTKESLVQLTNEIIMIKTMLDINCCSVLSSLTWDNVLEIIKNYKSNNDKVIPILVVNIIFKTPTPGVKDTIVRFQYNICNIT